MSIWPIPSRSNRLADVEPEIQRYYQRVHPSRNIETIYGIGEKLGPVFVAIIPGLRQGRQRP